MKTIFTFYFLLDLNHRFLLLCSYCKDTDVHKLKTFLKLPGRLLEPVAARASIRFLFRLCMLPSGFLVCSTAGFFSNTKWCEHTVVMTSLKKWCRPVKKCASADCVGEEQCE